MDKLKLRWAVTVTLYRKSGYKSYDNSLLQSIVMADTDDEAITKSVQSESVAKKLADGWTLNFKVAIPIAEYNSETSKYEYPKEPYEK